MLFRGMKLVSKPEIKKLPAAQACWLTQRIEQCFKLLQDINIQEAYERSIYLMCLHV